MFRRVVGEIQGVVQQAAWMAIEIQSPSDGRWRVLLARDAKFAVDWFRKPENGTLVQNALRSAIGSEVQVEWIVTDRALPPGGKPLDSVVHTPEANAGGAPVAQNQRIREAMNHPLIKKFMEVFDGHVLRVDDPPDRSVPPPKTVGGSSSIADRGENSTASMEPATDGEGQ